MVSTLEIQPQVERLKNWSGNLTYSTGNIFYPTTIGGVQELVKKLDNLTALGTKHCFNNIADNAFNLISTQMLNKVISIDKTKQTVTVEGGIKYGELCPWLDKQGFALHNLASLPHISVAGCISTATHGSGVNNGNLASVVRSIELVTANGNLLELTKEKDGNLFLAAVVGLGALGVITKVTLAVEPSYQVRQHVFTNLPVTALIGNFSDIVSAGYSVSLFTNWQTEAINEVWIKNRIDNGRNYDGIEDFFGAKAATKNLHPIAEISADNSTEQMGVAGAWHERLPHFKMGFIPSSGVELQSEFFVSMYHAPEALLAVATLGKLLGPHLLISEIRTIAADELWMSPCYKQASVAIHFTWQQHIPEVMKLLPLVEKILAPFYARPHWGKLFTMSPQVLATRYEKIEDFKALADQYDPAKKFRNDFLNHYLCNLS